MSDSRTVSIGIVGAGEIVRRSHLPVLVNIPGAKVDWIYDHRPERAIALAHAYGLHAIHSMSSDELPPCDIALLAIPVEARDEYLRHFAAAGSAVLCEKPFALTAAEHAHAVAQFPAHALACGFMRRFYRSTILLKEIVASGMLGPLFKIDVSEGGRSKGSGADASFLDDPRLGASRGVLMDLGSHSIDLALFISGADAFDIVSCDKELDGSVDRKVTAVVNLRNSSLPDVPAVELNYGVSWLDRQANRIHLQFERAAVWGELAVSGGVFLGAYRPPSVGGPQPGSGGARSPFDLSLESQTSGARTYSQAFYLEWRDFIDGVRERRESRISARSALMTTSLVHGLLTARGSTNA